MNIITNILFSIYLYFLLKIESTYFYVIVVGIFFPHFELLLTLFIKNRLKVSNKIFHSIPILLLVNLASSFIFVKFLGDLNYFYVFLFLFLGNSIHLFSDLLKSKATYLLYPFKNTGFSFSISNYFDLAPIIILVISNFLIIFLKLETIRLELFLPLLMLVMYFLLRFLVKRIISKKILFDLEGDYDVFIAPTLKITVWNVIRVTKNNVYLFQLDVIKRKYLFVKYFANNIDKDDLNDINQSSLFSEFKSVHNLLYYQSYELKNKTKIIRVFDVKNFFNLFKREQRYYEVKISNKKLNKEKIIL